MRKVAPAVHRFFPEMWSSDRRLVIFVGQDSANPQDRWSFCITRATLELLCPGLEPEDAFARRREAIYGAATARMLRRRPGGRALLLSAEDIGSHVKR
jgi:hypothetical protein